MSLMPSAVAVEAIRLGIRVEKPTGLKDAATIAVLRAQNADAMVVAAYGVILPQAVLDVPHHGCMNIHGSLLPRWRGAAPVQRAIEAGDKETGVTIMQMDKGLDTGAILLERRLPIAADESSATLFAKLTVLGAEAIVEALATLPELRPRPQPDSGVTYARKIEKAEARIDWSQPATVIERRMRAFDPFPGCETNMGGQTLKIWRAEVMDHDGAGQPGRVMESPPGTVIVKCGERALRLGVVQKRGGRRMPVEEYLRGTPIPAGTVLS